MCIRDRYQDKWGIDWNGVIEIKSEGLENILKRVGDKEYKKKAEIIERNSSCMKKRQLSLGWDGKDLMKTDMSWLGKIILIGTTNRINESLQNA